MDGLRREHVLPSTLGVNTKEDEQLYNEESFKANCIHTNYENKMSCDMLSITNAPQASEIEKLAIQLLFHLADKVHFLYKLLFLFFSISIFQQGLHQV